MPFHRHSKLTKNYSAYCFKINIHLFKYHEPKRHIPFPDQLKTPKHTRQVV